MHASELGASRARIATLERANANPPRRSRAKWTESILTTSTGITLQARGAGASFRGTRVGPMRPDLIICDDIEKDEHVETLDGRIRLENWLRRVVIPALAPHGRLIILGSIIHHDSLLANLRDRARFPRWEYRVYRAIEARRQPDGAHRLEPLWPARWPLEKLNAERERIGSVAFEQEYMANPIDTSLRVFRPEWLRRCKPDDLAGKKLLKLIAVDPATGASNGDYFALWVGGVEQDSGRIYTLELTLERIGIVEQVRRIVDAFERHRPLRIGIETVAYQVALRDILADHSRTQRLYMPIVSINSTANKRARIEGSAPFFENGTFLLPERLDPEAETQFLHFPKAGHDDAPDVCAMAIELARGLRAAGRIEGATAGSNPFARRGAW